MKKLIFILICMMTTILFSCKNILRTGTFTDSRDGKIYKTVRIGKQTWMAENLAYLPRVSPPIEGSEVKDLAVDTLAVDTLAVDSLTEGLVTENSEVENLEVEGSEVENLKTEDYYYVYGYEGTIVEEAKLTDNYLTYGVLYNWTAAMSGYGSSYVNPSGVQGICPDGWHLPSDPEWSELVDFLGGNNAASDKLKEVGTTHWSLDTLATNQSKFTALPGGFRYHGGSFNDIRNYGYWWSSSESHTHGAYYWNMGYNISDISRGNGAKEWGISVRCIKN